MRGYETPEGSFMKFDELIDIHDIITFANVGDIGQGVRGVAGINCPHFPWAWAVVLIHSGTTVCVCV